MERIEGQCHCRAITVSVPADTFGLIACHCQDCLKLHGNSFVMLAAASEAVRWSGEIAPAWYASSAQAHRAHCPRCGPRLAKRPVDGQRTLVSAGLFDRHLPRRIEKHVWADARPDWAQLPESGQAASSPAGGNRA